MVGYRARWVGLIHGWMQQRKRCPPLPSAAVAIVSLSPAPEQVRGPGRLRAAVSDLLEPAQLAELFHEAASELHLAAERVELAADVRSPHALKGTIAFAPTDDVGGPVKARLFAGPYEARSPPVADSDPATGLDSSVALVPGRYDLLVRADGFGTRRLSLDVAAGQRHTLAPALAGNVASAARGAIAAGDGAGHANLIDETEDTEWRRWARR